MLLAAIAVLAGCGCSGTPSREPAVAPAPVRRELTAQELRELLSRGTIRPVLEMEGDDPFWGLDPGMEGNDQPTTPPRESGERNAANDRPAEAQPVAPAPPPNPYLQFGARIKVYPDGTITKPYPLRVGTGVRLKKLLEDYGNFPLWTPELGAGPSSPVNVKLDLLEKWDVELYQDLRNAAVAAGAEQPLADWLVVTAGAELLQEVEDFINLFAAGVPQIEIEAKIVEISLTNVLDIGVRSPDPAVPMFQFPSKTFVKGFDSAMPNSSDGIEGLLTVGGVQDAVTFNAALEALAINDNVSIISRPKIAVREGGRADITNTTKIPFLNVGGINNVGGYNATVAFQEVGVKLYVVPRVVGTQTVALNIDVEQSQQSGSETVLVTADNSAVQVPVISNRTARTVVYLQPGQAVILGGLITERSVQTERKVPLLGDIPVLRHLFRSEFTRKEQTNVLFFIRPRILQGSDLNRQF